MVTARKWVAAGFGGPEVLRNIEADVPDPGPGQATISVRAAGAVGMSVLQQARLLGARVVGTASPALRTPQAHPSRAQLIRRLTGSAYDRFQRTRLAGS